MAISLYCYHFFFHSEYDHIGVVFLDESNDPLLVELSTYSGVRMSPVSERIDSSRAHQIALVPLLPRIEYNSLQRSNIINKVTEKVKKENTWWQSEVLNIPWAIIRRLFSSFSYSSPSSSYGWCPNARLARDFLQILGIQLIRKESTDIQRERWMINCADFMNKRVVDPTNKVKLDENTVVIRMK